MENDFDEDMLDEIVLEVPTEPLTWRYGAVDLVSAFVRKSAQETSRGRAVWLTW